MTPNDLLEKSHNAKVSGGYKKCISLANEAIGLSDDLETKTRGMLVRSCAKYYLSKQDNIQKVKKILLKLRIKKDLDFILEKSANVRTRTLATEMLIIISSNREEINPWMNLGIFEIEISSLSPQEQKNLIMRLEIAQCLAFLKSKKLSVEIAKKIEAKLLGFLAEIPADDRLLAGIIFKNAAMCRISRMRKAWCTTGRRRQRQKAVEYLNSALELYPAEETAHINSAQEILRMIT